MKDPPRVLVVAGSDSSGGAGLARDIEAVAACGLGTCLAVTAVTVQTHHRVERVKPMPPALVAAQMRAAFAANTVAAVKIGMLAGSANVVAVATVLDAHGQVPVVLDPVLASSSGATLLPQAAIATLRRKLLPLVDVVTPNLPELALLTASALAQSEAEMERQGNCLLSAGCGAVLVKGGHATGTDATDILLRPGHPPLRLRMPRLAATMRGTGCMLASTVAALLARGESLESSVRSAKQAVFARLAPVAGDCPSLTQTP